MNGSRPKPPARPNVPPPRRKRAKPKRRPTPSNTPWLLISLLFIIYLLIGLLIALPSSPYWVWIATIVAIPLLVLGVNRPSLPSGKTDRGGLMAYLGGLIMAIALAVAANYIGNESSVDDVAFFTAIAALAGLTILAVVLTVAAAVASAATGASLMTKAAYSRSVIMVMTVSFLGLCVGGVSGLFVTTLNATT